MADHSPTTAPRRRRWHAGQRAFVALLLAAVGEGVVTLIQTLAHGAGVGEALVGLSFTVGLLLPVVAGGSALAWVLVGGDAATRFWPGLTSALAGSPRAGSVAVLVLAAGFGGATLIAVTLGVRFEQNMTERFAALATGLVALGSLPVLIGLFGLLGRPFGRAVASSSIRAVRSLGHSAAGFTLLGALTGLAIAKTLDWVWVVLPVSFVVGLGAAPLGRVERAFPWAMVIGLGLGCATWPLLGGALPASVGSVLRTGPPYAGLLVRGVESFFDADDDGYARPPIGRDCDDARESVNPGARDVPGNGVDENCSGLDGVVYALPPAPPSTRPAGVPDRPNVVLLMLDTLRPDHMSGAGYERNTTPNLDRFRETATLYTHARTTSVGSFLSLTSIFTGYYVQGLAIHVIPGLTTIMPEVQTLAEQLRGRGYATAGFSIPHFFHVSRGLGQGFSTFESPWPIDEWEDYLGRSDPMTTDAALGFLENRPADRPFFLFAHYQCAHGPYVRHPEHDFGSDSTAQYDSGVASCDEHVGRLLDALDGPPYRESTAVIIFSDHGEELGYRGHEYHGSSLYEPAIRTLLLMRVPGAEMPSSVDAPVVLTDINPTIRDLTGVAKPTNLHGWSLFTERPRANRPLFFFTGHVGRTTPVMIHGLLYEDQMLFRDTQTGTIELYDMAADPSQERNLASSDPDTVSRMSEMLEGLFEYISRRVR